MLQKKVDPCKLCIVNPCCEKREQKCQLLREWNHRNDWIKKLAGAICVVPISILSIAVLILIGDTLDDTY